MDSNPDLNEVARQTRVLSLKAIHASRAAHPGGVLSCADILAALFFRVMRPQPYDFDDLNRDLFLIDKGHSVPGVYSILYLLGRIDEPTLMSLRKTGSPTQGHPARIWTPEVVTSSGSLGQVTAFSVGLALALKKKGSEARCYCLLGDGSIQEGVTAEAARLAAHWRLDNLAFVCDRNRKTSDGHSIDPVRNARAEFGAWGWWTEDCDGHDAGQVASILEFAMKKTSRPFFLEANTVKGKGISFMENDPSGYHGSLFLSDDELKNSLKELEEA